MSVIEKVVDRAIGKGWAPASDKQAILNRIERLSQSYGFTPDDFGIAVCTESYGLNPKADNNSSSVNGCTGIIQFCPSKPRQAPGIKSIKGKKYNLKAIKNMSILQQLELTDNYYSEIISNSAKKNMPGVRLYFYVLLPVVAAQFDKIQPTENLKDFLTREYSASTAKLLNGQAARFYVGEKQNGVITINSVKAGLEKFAQTLLGEPVGFSSGGGNFTNSSNTISGTGGLGLNNPFGIITGTINGICPDMFPIEFSLKEAVTYKGCLNKIASSVMGGNSLAYPAQGMRINGAGSISLADYDPSVPIAPGSLGKPLNVSNMILTGNSGVYGAKRTSKRTGKPYWHSGQDYGTSDGSLGKEIIAVADGEIVNTSYIGGYDPGAVEMICPQLGNLFVRYGHVIPSVQVGQKVKKGDVLGKIGQYVSVKTGKKLGYPHLHLELRKDKGKGFSAWSPEQLRAETINPALYCKRK